MWRLWGLGIGLLGVMGCETLHTGVQRGVDFLFGTPEGQAAMAGVGTATAGLPFPWNLVALGVVAGVTAAGGAYVASKPKPPAA